MKQNLRKKALVPAISMVLASVIALSGVTYAWFTTGNTAEVTGLDVNVKTASGIQVSLDTEAWSSIISGKDIMTAIANGTYDGSANQYPTDEISPVSSAGNVVNGKMEMFYGQISENGALSTTPEVEVEGTSGNFVAFDLFFNSPIAQPLTLDVAEAASSVVGKVVGTTGRADAGAERAVRVAFLPLGTADDAANALTLTGEGTVTPLIWEPNSTARAKGVTATGKLPYKGVNSEINGVQLSDLTAQHVTDMTTFDGVQKIVDLEPGITKIRVYIWLEGQDADCVNSISFGDFGVNLSFFVPKASSGT